MKIVFLDAKTLGADLDLSSLAEFGEFVRYETTAANETISRLQGADIVITNKVLITKEVIDACDLKLICVAATGTNNVDMEYAKEKGIPVKNVAGYSTNSVTQQVFANLLTLVGKIPFYNDLVLSKKWSQSGLFTNIDKPFYELNGKKFGIIGLGTIGKNVASVARAFGCEICYYSTSGKNANSEFKRVELDEMLKTCDIISIHAPLNENTKNLLNEGNLGKLKKGAILMNFGRGGIVNEKAVASALNSGEIYFISDVFEKEPMSEDNPLLNLKFPENVLFTPHLAWASKEARVKLLELMKKNISEFLGI